MLKRPKLHWHSTDKDIICFKNITMGKTFEFIFREEEKNGGTKEY